MSGAKRPRVNISEHDPGIFIKDTRLSFRYNGTGYTGVVQDFDSATNKVIFSNVMTLDGTAIEGLEPIDAINITDITAMPAGSVGPEVSSQNLGRVGSQNPDIEELYSSEAEAEAESESKPKAKRSVEPPAIGGSRRRSKKSKKSKQSKKRHKRRKSVRK